MRQVLGLGALGRPRGIGWRERWEGGSGWGIHVYPWLIHVNVWQEPLQCCEVVSLQLKKKKKKKKNPEPKELGTIWLLLPSDSLCSCFSHPEVAYQVPLARQPEQFPRAVPWEPRLTALCQFPSTRVQIIFALVSEFYTDSFPWADIAWKSRANGTTFKQ